MRTKMLLCLVVSLLPCGALRAESENLEKVTMSVLAEAYPAVSRLFERAKIETTWSGFYLKAGRQYGFDSHSRADLKDGIWVGVRVIAKEDMAIIDQFVDRSRVGKVMREEGNTEKMTLIENPNEGGDGAVVICVSYADQCPKEAVAEVEKAIALVKERMK